MKGELSKIGWSGNAFLSSWSLNTDMNKMKKQAIGRSRVYSRQREQQALRYWGRNKPWCIQGGVRRTLWINCSVQEGTW